MWTEDFESLNLKEVQSTASKLQTFVDKAMDGIGEGAKKAHKQKRAFFGVGMILDRLEALGQVSRLSPATAGTISNGNSNITADIGAYGISEPAGRVPSASKLRV